MLELLTTLLATIPLFIGAALVINVCRKRAARTRHPLTGMCAKSGDTMCCSCSSALQDKNKIADCR
ncbi:MAG: hypothetical protein V2I35_13480 [Desulfocapsaceae bacterium]|nr:hypothetical protein [Desulfocapsaceae bacterium]